MHRPVIKKSALKIRQSSLDSDQLPPPTKTNSLHFAPSVPSLPTIETVKSSSLLQPAVQSSLFPTVDQKSTCSSLVKKELSGDSLLNVKVGRSLANRIHENLSGTHPTRSSIRSSLSWKDLKNQIRKKKEGWIILTAFEDLK